MKSSTLVDNFKQAIEVARTEDQPARVQNLMEHRNLRRGV